jgi:hypothetical protein
MRTYITRQPATQPAFGKWPVGFALFRPVAVRCVPFWQEAAPVVGWRWWRWWRWCWRRWSWACVASCPGAEVGVGDAACARVPAVPAGASPEMVRGRLRSGVRRGAARRRPCPAFAWRRGRWEPWRRCPSAAPDLLLPSLSKPPRCGWLPCRARNVSGPGGRQRGSVRVGAKMERRCGDKATKMERSRPGSPLESASRKATPPGTRLRVRELAAHRRRIHCSANPPIRLRSSASPQPRIHAPDRCASRDADS